MNNEENGATAVAGGYPARSTVLIVFGEAGSASSVAQRLGFEGRQFSVRSFREAQDVIKLDWPFYAKHLKHFWKLDLSDSGDLKMLEEFCVQQGFDAAQREAFFTNLAYVLPNPPNALFEVSPGSRDPVSISSMCDCRYGIRRMHIAWVLNDAAPDTLRKAYADAERWIEPADYSDDGFPFGERFDGDLWFCLPPDGASGERRVLRIKEVAKPLVDFETLQNMVHNR